MSLSGREYLQHILDEADYLVDRCRGLDRESFLGDQTIRRAFVRSREIIGEAAKRCRRTFAISIPIWSGAAWLGCGTG